MDTVHMIYLMNPKLVYLEDTMLFHLLFIMAQASLIFIHIDMFLD